MITPTTTTLYSIWGYDENDVYAVGWAGTIIHYDGTVWTEVENNTDFGFLSIWGTAGGPLYVAGQTVLTYDGGDWTPVKVRNEPDFTDLWASANGSWNEMIAVGSGGNILYRTSSFSFSSMTINGDLTVDLNGVGGYDDSAMFIVGNGGLILERTAATEWADMSSGITADLQAVAMLSDTLAMAVGTGGTLAKYDGSSWTEPDAALLSEDLYDVWLGLSTTEAIIGYAVGAGGAITGYNGVNWELMSGPTAVPLQSVVGFASGEAFAVGDAGTIIHLVSGATDWITVTSGTIENLTAIWAISESDMFITAEAGRVFWFDGNSLTELETNADINLTGIVGQNATNVYVVGDHNHILRYSN